MILSFALQPTDTADVRTAEKLLGVVEPVLLDVAKY